MNQLLQLDQELFLWINRGWTHPWLDATLPLARNMYFWAPLYLFFIAWLSINFGKKGWMVVFLVLVTFAWTDFASSSLIKPMVGRLRPCNDPNLAEYVRLLVGCGGGKSFTSSHAANHFGVALFLGQVFRPFFKPALLLLLLWAGTISLAQVYVGVHYPLDVSVGALLGVSIGAVSFRLYQKHFNLLR
jgi:membrane-associated phospholipid phosphatase